MAWKDKGTQDFKNKTFASSFGFALEGFKTIFKEERNMRIHLFFGLVAVIFSALFKLNRTEWLWIILVIFLVLIMETINTVIETVVDLTTNYHFHHLAKKAKDMAAAGVVLTAVLALIVGSVIFLPKIYLLLT